MTMTGVDAAEQTLSGLRAKLGAIDERLEVNAKTQAQLRRAAFVDGDVKSKRQIDQLLTEAFHVECERRHIAALVVEGEQHLEQARRDEQTAGNRARAEAAREKFAVLAHALQDFSNLVNGLIPAKDRGRAALDALHPTGFGPNDRQVLRWMQRYLIAAVQVDRDLRCEDQMASGDERKWLARAPADWLGHLQVNTARVLDEPPAEAAE
jgi:hypothetical protein